MNGLKQLEPIRKQEDILKMYEVLKRISTRDYLFFKFAIHTGLKLTHLLNLTVADILDSNDEVVPEWYESHASHIRIQLPQTLRHELKAFVEDHHMTEASLLFQSKRTKKGLSRQQAYRIISKPAKELGLERVGITTLRKTFAYHAYKSGISIAIIQKYLGHQTPNETIKFICINPFKKTTTIALNL